MGSTAQTILVVDDEANLRKVLTAMLRREGFDVLSAPDGQAALDVMGDRPVDVVLTDLKMPRLDGMGVLERVGAEYPGVPVVMLTAHGTVDTAVTAMKLGAFDYLTKPFDAEELRVVMKKAAAAADLSQQEPSRDTQGRFGITGKAPVIEEVFRTIEKVAPSPSTVLITGESGTGKELVARALHEHSPRAARPFIRINCAAIPRELIESELFGYEKGAFTGAVSSKPGRFELADEGTLFLDEIGEIPLEMQVKLLRVLQESEFERVGGVTTTRVDVRLVAATNQDLAAEVQAGRFREDLFYRLNVVPVGLPPLRDRKEDIPLLCGHFLDKYNERLDKAVEGLDAGAHDAFARYDWPGNIRELENVMERAILFAEGPTITVDVLPDAIRAGAVARAPAAPEAADDGAVTEPQPPAAPRAPSNPEPPTADLAPSSPVGPLKEIVRQHTETLEKDLIQRALAETNGNVTKAARRLEISRKSLQNKMKELGLRDASPDHEPSTPPSREP